MPQFLNRWVEWFRAQRAVTQAGIVNFALLVGILASPVLRWVATVGFIAVLIAPIARAVRGASVRHLVIAAGVLLAAAVGFAAMAAAVYGPNGGGSQEAQREEATQPEPSGAQEPTGVVSEVSAPEPIDTTEAAPAPEPPTKRAGPGHEWIHEWIPTAIPGLVPVEVYGNLKARGFGCEGPARVGGESVRRCTGSDTRAEYTVEIWGPDASSVRLVEATVLSFDPSTTNETAADFLGHLATVPYEGSNPEEAKLWVQDNVDTTRPLTTKIGGAEYVLSGSGDARILEIHPPGSSG